MKTSKAVRVGPALLGLVLFSANAHTVRSRPACDELKHDTRTVVYYRTPLFGKPFVTKVVWVNGG